MSWFCVIHSIYLVSSIFVSVKIEYDTPLMLHILILHFIFLTELEK